MGLIREIIAAAATGAVVGLIAAGIAAVVHYCGNRRTGR